MFMQGSVPAAIPVPHKGAMFTLKVYRGTKRTMTVLIPMEMYTVHLIKLPECDALAYENIASLRNVCAKGSDKLVREQKRPPREVFFVFGILILIQRAACIHNRFSSAMPGDVDGVGWSGAQAGFAAG